MTPATVHLASAMMASLSSALAIFVRDFCASCVTSLQSTPARLASPAMRPVWQRVDSFRTVAASFWTLAAMVLRQAISEAVKASAGRGARKTASARTSIGR
ncbi:MAG: hypothetical protein B6D46_16085 [Polyangiaceae bacterium UTPRO1]|nr:MAG: hypothetical protein B6D46_16085 [Polyangiaceae bacterium UTPRO1]